LLTIMLSQVSETKSDVLRAVRNDVVTLYTFCEIKNVTDSSHVGVVKPPWYATKVDRAIFMVDMRVLTSRL